MKDKIDFIIFRHYKFYDDSRKEFIKSERVGSFQATRMRNGKYRLQGEVDLRASEIARPIFDIQYGYIKDVIGWLR